MKHTLKRIIIDAIQTEDAAPFTNDREALQYAADRFHGEMSWQWKERGHTKEAAAKDWFQGLALAVPYMDGEIEELGFNPFTYWGCLARTFLFVLRKEGIAIQ